MSTLIGGKRVLVTAGGSGIGRAIVDRFIAAGAHVHTCDVQKDFLKEVVSTNERVTASLADVGVPGEVETLVADAVDAMGGVDVLINNAGTSQRGPFMDIPDELWQDDLDLKLFASIRLTRLLFPGMCERQWGRIINVLNVGAKIPSAEGAPTQVTRAAGMALMKVLACEGAPHNVLVNGLLVGKIRSDQWERRHAVDERGLTLEEWYEDAGQTQPLGRLGHAEEFANMACFLCSEQGSYINGAAINVDGGLCQAV